MFRKIFSDVWLCSWKYHKKHIFYLLLTFSQLPNEYIISFIPKNTNKPRKDHIFSVRSRSREASIAIARSVDCDRARSTRSRSQSRRSRSRDRAKRWSRWRLTPIGAITVIMIAINADCSLSPSLSVHGFFLLVALSLFCAFSGNRLKVKQQCKMIFESIM